MGPTASGKTKLAVELVQKLPCEIISVDSALIYKGMDIGSGKPDAETLRRAPHRLIDIRDPGEAYSAAEFRHDALREMAQITAAGKIPLLVGGTMLYFKILREGMADLPAADAAVRSRISALAEKSGWQAVHQRLAEVDEESARRIHPNDPQRLQRALEVYEVSGKTMSQLQKRQEQQDGGNSPPYKLHYFALYPRQRKVLHGHIEKRFRTMLAQGLVDEVRNLYARPELHAQLPSMRAVGYRQVWEFLATESSDESHYEIMVQKGLAATRQLAKRQLTWLRSWPELDTFDSEDQQILAKVLKKMEDASI